MNTVTAYCEARICSDPAVVIAASAVIYRTATEGGETLAENYSSASQEQVSQFEDSFTIEVFISAPSTVGLLCH